MVCAGQRRVDRPAVQSVQGLVRLVVGHAKFTREKGTYIGDNISLRRLFVVWLAVIAGPHVFAPCPPQIDIWVASSPPLYLIYVCLGVVMLGTLLKPADTRQSPVCRIRYSLPLRL